MMKRSFLESIIDKYRWNKFPFLPSLIHLFILISFISLTCTFILISLLIIHLISPGDVSSTFITLKNVDNILFIYNDASWFIILITTPIYLLFIFIYLFLFTIDLLRKIKYKKELIIINKYTIIYTILLSIAILINLYLFNSLNKSNIIIDKALSTCITEYEYNKYKEKITFHEKYRLMRQCLHFKSTNTEKDNAIFKVNTGTWDIYIKEKFKKSAFEMLSDSIILGGKNKNEPLIH